MLDDLVGKITCADCLDILKQLPDKCVDLVLTDPPYGIDYGTQLSKNFTTQKKGEVNPKNGYKNYGVNEWDKERPQPEIFRELLRVSKNQIIWGGNYFADLLPRHKVGWFGIKCKGILLWPMASWRGQVSIRHCGFLIIPAVLHYKTVKYTQHKNRCDYLSGA